MNASKLAAPDRVALGVLGVTVLATAAAYRSLPMRIATHFDWRGQPDSWQPRALAVLILPALAAALFALPWAIAARQRASMPGMPWVSAGTVGFLCTVHIFLLAYAKDPAFDMIQATCIACGALYVVLGLVMPRARQNPFIGVRTPWTLRSPEVWSRTQRLAGWLFSGGGVFMVGSALLAPQLALPVMLVLTLLITTACLLYSWRIGVSLQR